MKRLQVMGMHAQLVERYGAQIRLAEWGYHGQESLAAQSAHVEGGLAAEVEARYLAGAGIGAIVTADHAVARAIESLNPAVRVIQGSAPQAARPACTVACVKVDAAIAPFVDGSLRALRHMQSVASVKPTRWRILVDGSREA